MDEFKEWLDNEIEDLKYKPDTEMVRGKLSEAIRIRAMLCQIDKECNKDTDKER